MSRSQHSSSAAVFSGGPGGSLDFLFDEDRGDRRAGRMALLGALLVHLLLFVIVWPSLSESPGETLRKKIIVCPVVHWVVPPIPPKVHPHRRARPVPIPALACQVPEPIREVEELQWEDLPLDPDALPIVEIPPLQAVDDSPIPVGLRGIRAPTVLRRVAPVYPETARRARYEADVVLDLVIDKKGAIESMAVVKGAALGLTEAAEKAVRQWLFEASTLNGRPVRIRYRLTVRFRLS